MKTINRMLLYGQLDPPQNFLRILEYPMEFWWESEAKLDYIGSNCSLIFRDIKNLGLRGMVSVKELDNSTRYEKDSQNFENNILDL